MQVQNKGVRKLKAMTAIKGMAVGVMTGTVAGVVGSKMMDKNTKKTMKKRAGKALKSMSNMLDTAQYMLK